jgi:uncharacterized protein (DUF1501 family)
VADLQPYLTGNGDHRQTLVVVFLRGGADGLNMIVPIEDDRYYRARPLLGLKKKATLPLDGFYGLNPRMKELEPLFREGTLAIVQAAGSEDSTRSHFEAQDLMEHGGVVAGGWLGRFLRSRPSPAGPLSAVAWGRTAPECLRGAPALAVMESFESFALGRTSKPLLAEIGRLYAEETGLLSDSGRDTLKALERIERLRNVPYRPDQNAEYGTDRFSQGLLHTARLIKARVGLEAASLDLNGWDSHFVQGTIMDPRMIQLSRGLSAFATDLGPDMKHTTLVVMTEFGRRVAENTSFGTDHGRGGVMLVLGGGVRGGRVYGRWPGLNDDVLKGPGDLPVTTNYRDVLAPILTRHSGEDYLQEVFPDYAMSPLPLYA